MGIPNSVLDPAPHVWGWPWHGLMKAVGSAGVLQLPSGREITCPAFGGNWTYLWDIGMPAVDYEPEDPDEQWLTKGIIRGNANTYPNYIYGGHQVASGPIKLGDFVGVMGVQFSWSDGEMSFNVSVSADIGDGPLYVEKVRRMTAAEAVFPETVPGGFTPQAEIVDRSKDGTRCIVRVTRARANALAYAGEVLALIEVQVSGEFATMDAALVLLAGGTDTRGVVTVTTEPPAYPAGVEFIGECLAKSGTWVTDSQLDAVVSAWYQPDGTIDLLNYQVHIYALQVNTLAGDAEHQTASRDWQVTTTRTLASNTATATTVVTTSQVTHVSVDVEASETHFTNSLRMHVGTMELLNLDETWDTSGGADFSGYWAAMRTDIDPVNQALLWLYRGTVPLGEAYIGRQSLLSFAGLSNNVLACPVQYLDNPDDVNSLRLVVYGDALTPGGVDSGLYSYHTGTTTKAGNNAGSYNPITGQVLRNQDTELFSWV